MYMNKHTPINTYGRKKDEKEKEKGERKAILWYLCIFKSVSMHVLLLLRARWRLEFSPETPPLICVSVSQSDLCQEVNAVRAWKIAWALFLMGNIWYSLRNCMMFFLSRFLTAWESQSIRANQSCVGHHESFKKVNIAQLFSTLSVLMTPQGTCGFTENNQSAS